MRPSVQCYRPLLYVLFILPAFVAAFNQANFTLFKNTQFGPCDPSVFPTNTSAPPSSTGDPQGSNYTFSTTSLTAFQFCDSFWNYTVIPTTPNDAAFSFTWLSCLSNCVSFLISALLLYRTTSVHGNAEYQELFHAKDAERQFFIPSQPAPAGSGIGTIFWLTLIYDSLKTGLWWFSFVQLFLKPASAARISLLQWITPYMYRVTLRYTLAPQRAWLRWLPVVLAIAQFSCSVFAAQLMASSLRLPINGDRNLTAVTYTLTDDPFLSPPGTSTPCAPADAAKVVLLSDPEAPVRQLIYFVGSLVAVLLFVPSVFVDLRGGNTRRFMWAYQVYATGAVEGIMALAIALVRWRSTPVSWNDDCAVVHVMMSPDVGYWDVDVSRFWRVLRAWFNV